jgi:Bacterial Ig domain/Cellulase (glycosyl hydrolase family 5)
VLALAAGLLSLCVLIGFGSGPTTAAAIGANKFDLLLQFLDTPPPAGVAAEGYRRVRRAMAAKAIADARDAGLTFLRVAVTGFSPADFDQKANDLALWQQDPPRFWVAADRMFDALDGAGIRLVPTFVWNLAQFPSLAKDSVATFVRDGDSASRQLLAQFIRDFTGRYKGRPTILFYELTNEMNLAADLDMHKRNCKTATCVWDDFTTAEMTAFARDMVGLIKSLDAAHPVSSGYSLGHTAASHLERRPEFAPGGPDWTADTTPDLARYLSEIHQPFDIVSVHLYPKPEATLFGRMPGEQYRLVNDAAGIARAAGKPLFIGEFGDKAGASPFLAHALDEIVQARVDYAAIWAWEFYQISTYQAAKFNVEPGFSDDIIGLLRETETRLGQMPPQPDAALPPRVVLTWPLPCATVDRPLDLAAVASDGAKPVQRVDFLVDGQPIATAATPPYTARLDPAGQRPRDATITARAVSQAGIAAEFHSTVGLNQAGVACQR